MQTVRGAVGGLLESAHNHHADVPDDLVNAPGGSLRHAVVEQVGQGGAVRMRGQLPDPCPQVGGDLGLDALAVLGDVAAPAEVGEVGGVSMEPADQDVVRKITEPEHVTDGAHADPLQDFPVRVGFPAVVDRVYVPGGGGAEQLIAVSVDRPGAETGVQRGAMGQVLGTREAHHVRVAVDGMEDVPGGPEDLVVPPGLVAQIPRW